jgi:hypothetical protein
MQYRSLHKWHVWLGWLIGVPLILWTASGLFMVAKPIDEVRGSHLRSDPSPVDAIQPVAPLLQGRAVETLTLEQRASGPVWVIKYSDGGARQADPATGELLPPISAGDAMMLASGYYTGKAKPTGAQRFAAENAPLDLRKERPSWRVSYDDGMRLYIDADSGALLAVRTRWWRAFDFMWGLHIMDLQTREDTHHPILIGFAGLALSGLLLAFIIQIWRPIWLRKVGKVADEIDASD